MKRDTRNFFASLFLTVVIFTLIGVKDIDYNGVPQLSSNILTSVFLLNWIGHWFFAGYKKIKYSLVFITIVFALIGAIELLTFNTDLAYIFLIVATPFLVPLYSIVYYFRESILILYVPLVLSIIAYFIGRATNGKLTFKKQNIN